MMVQYCVRGPFWIRMMMVADLQQQPFTTTSVHSHMGLLQRFPYLPSPCSCSCLVPEMWGPWFLIQLTQTCGLWVWVWEWVWVGCGHVTAGLRFSCRAEWTAAPMKVCVVLLQPVLCAVNGWCYISRFVAIPLLGGAPSVGFIAILYHYPVPPPCRGSVCPQPHNLHGWCPEWG